MLKNKLELEEEFYKKDFYFSYSSLNKLLFLPSSFYSHYILNKREEKLESYLVEGRIIHCLLLEPKNFKKQFVIVPNKTPTGNTLKLLYDIFRNKKASNDLTDYKKEILNWLSENNLHQSLKEDDKRIEKILTKNNIEYFKHLCELKNKTQIDTETYNICLEKVKIIKSNKEAYNLIKPNSSGFELVLVENEKYLKCKLKDYPFGLHGIIDNLTIDYENKIVTINDLKTTNKSLIDFKQTIDFYKYWLQAAIYLKLVKENYENITDFKFKFNFIVIDNYKQSYVFKVTDKTLLDWQAQLEEILKIANYHYTNKDYTLPFEFAMGHITL
jgi:hypothetical protein